MRLRDTESGRKWLEQFPDEERIAAGLLLDAILITTTDQIKSDIEAAIHEIVSLSDNSFYIAPVISKRDVEVHLELKRDKSEPMRDSADPLRMFDDYQPLDLVGDPDAGSENYLALVARDIRKSYPARSKFDGSLEKFCEAKKAKSRLDFIFIVDNSMSGSQVAFFMDSFWRSEQVSSFLEGQQTRIQVHLICWGATRQVIDILDSAPEYLKVNRTIVCQVPTVETVFPPGDALDAIMHIIQKYPKAADPTVVGKKGLGFLDTGALFLPLGASAPNNMPELLTRSHSNNARYAALFRGRRIPPDIKAITPSPSPLPLRNVDSYYEKLRKKKLLTAVKISKEGQSKEWAMLLLMALHYTETDIRTELGLSYIESKRILELFKQIGWATSGFTLTQSGQKSLREFGRHENYSEYKRGVRYVHAEIDGERGAYYPKSVRGVK